MDNTILERLKKEIESFSPDAKPAEVGIVRKVGDGIVEIEGLSDAMMAEMVHFDEASAGSVKNAISKNDELFGVVLNLEEDAVKATVLGDSARIREGMLVKRTKKLLSIPVGEAFIGRIVNALGEPV